MDRAKAFESFLYGVFEMLTDDEFEDLSEHYYYSLYDECEDDVEKKAIENGEGDVSAYSTFVTAGIMDATLKGLVVRLADGTELQINVVLSKRGGE